MARRRKPAGESVPLADFDTALANAAAALADSPPFPCSDGRSDPDDGTGAEGEGGPPRDGQGEYPRTGRAGRQPADILQVIGARFKKAREESQDFAFRQLTDDIAEHLGILCSPDRWGNVTINLKDAMAMLRENEDFIRQGKGGAQSPLDALRQFLGQA